MRMIDTAIFRTWIVVCALLLIGMTLYVPGGSSEESDANTSPVITTEPITINMEDLEYAIDFDATDPDVGDKLTWSVVTLLANLTMFPDSGLLNGIPSNDDVGDWDVNVSVNDGNGGMDSIEFVLSVWNRNDDPVITSTPENEVDEDSQYMFDMDAIDVDPTEDVLTWSLDTNPGFISIDSESGEISGIPSNDDVGSHDIVVNVSDGNEGYAILEYVLTVQNINDPPFINDTEMTDATEDEPYWFVIGGYDIDFGDVATWSIVTGADFMTIDPTTGNITGTPLNQHVGDWWIVARLTDEIGEFVEVNLSFEVQNVNDDPIIMGNPILTAYEDESFWYVFSSSDIDPTEDTLSWSLRTDAGFISLDADGNLSGNPTNEDVGDWWINITLSDGNQGSDTINFTLKVNNINDDPTIETENILTAIEDASYSNEYIAIDIDPTEDHLTWSLQTDAGFLEIDEFTGFLSGKPKNRDVGDWWVNVTVSDNTGGLSWTNFTISVSNVNDKPVLIVSQMSTSMDEDGESHTVNLTEIFEDPDLDQLDYSYESSDNLTVSIEGDVLTIIPKANWSGKEKVKLTATDGGEEVCMMITLTVSNVNDPPFNVVITGRDEYVEYGNQIVSASAEDLDLMYGDSLSYTWSSDTMGQLGSGKEINLSLPVGKHMITCTVTDQSGTSITDTFEIEVMEREKEEAFPWWIPLLIGIVILLIILAVLLFLLLKKEPEPDETKAEEMGTTEDPVVDAGEPSEIPQDQGADVYGGAMQPQEGYAYPQEPPVNEAVPEAPVEQPIGYPEAGEVPAEPPMDSIPEPGIEPPVEGSGMEVPADIPAPQPPIEP